MQAFEIPSSSMEDTLLIGDHVFRESRAIRSQEFVGGTAAFRIAIRGETRS